MPGYAFAEIRGGKRAGKCLLANKSRYAAQDQAWVDFMAEGNAALTRGDIWTSAGGADYGGKPRPVVIVQHGDFARSRFGTFCGFTCDPTDLPLFRIAIEPSDMNGLEFPSRIMVDKILTTPKSKLGYRIGTLDDRDIVRLNETLRISWGWLARASNKCYRARAGDADDGGRRRRAAGGEGEDGGAVRGQYGARKRRS